MTVTAIMMTTMIKHKSKLRLRHELKYSISRAEDMELSSRLRKIFPHDTHAGSHGSYRVSSLYFDTPYDKALRRKLDGTNRREKFRIRYYGETPDFLRLERKLKINGLCAKQTARLSVEEVTRLLSGDHEFLRTKENPLLLEFYSKLQGELLRPKSIVCYDREAFTYPPGNVRVTIDRDLRTSLHCVDFLNGLRQHMGVSDEMSVLEVKFDEFLPDIARMAVQTSNQRAVAYSKYAVCRKYE